MPLIMVDTNEDTDREKNKKDRHLRPDNSNLRVVKRLQKRFPELMVSPLTCGDINVVLDDGKLIAIERKRAGDFLGSIKEGHIARQVQRMADNADWSVVIIEGFISFDRDDMAVIPVFDKSDNLVGQETTGWHGEAVRAMIYAIQFNGTPVVTIQHPSQLPDIVESFIRFCSKPTEHTQMLPRRRIVSFPPVTLQEEIIAAFPGIGLKRTRALRDFAANNNDEIHGSEHQNTPVLAEMMCWASYLLKIDQKSRPEGWGNITVQNFRAALGLNDGQYLTIEVDKEEVEAKRQQKLKEGRTNGHKPSKTISKH